MQGRISDLLSLLPRMAVIPSSLPVWCFPLVSHQAGCSCGCSWAQKPWWWPQSS